MLRLTAVLCALFGVNGANAQTCTSLCDSLPATVEWSSVTDCAVEFSLSFVSDSDGEALDAANAIWELNGNEVATGAQCAIPAAEVQAGGTLVVTRSGLDAFADCSCSQTISLAEVSDDMVWHAHAIRFKEHRLSNTCPKMPAFLFILLYQFRQNWVV